MTSYFLSFTDSSKLVVGAVVLCFVLIVCVTIYGLVRKDSIDPKLMKTLVASVLVMTASAVFTQFGNVNVNEDADKFRQLIGELHSLVPEVDKNDPRKIIAGVQERIGSDSRILEIEKKNREQDATRIADLEADLKISQLKLSKIDGEKQKFIDYLKRLGLSADEDPPTAKALIDAIFNSGDLKDAFVSHLKGRDYYCVEQPEYVEKKIRNYPPDHNVSVELLDLLNEGKGPFVPQRKKIYLSVPTGNSIPDGVCVVRANGPFAGHIVKVSSGALNPKPTILIAKQLHYASVDETGAELIQVNEQTAKSILGIDFLPAKSEAWARSYPQ